MALSILNNISSLNAENALSGTQASLQKTLTQLSTGLKINSGADDAAGLSIANGMQANIAALTQSQQNASNGIGMLQTADGALAQVTKLLNRAVTLATEASTGGITGSQATALNTEFTSIQNEINQIGTNTNFNGQQVFSQSGQETWTSTAAALTAASSLTADAGKVVTVSTNSGANVYNYTIQAGDTVQTVINNINKNVAGVSASLQGGALFLSSGDASMTLTGTEAAGGTVLNGAGTLAANATVANQNVAFISDGVSTVNTTIATTMNAVSTTRLGISADNLNGAPAAQTALQHLVNGATAAINLVAADRGAIGASINRLTAASGVMSNQVTNLQSAENSISNADIGQTVASMTQYNVLQSTGMAALQQSNQAQQAVLKLVQ